MFLEMEIQVCFRFTYYLRTNSHCVIMHCRFNKAQYTVCIDGQKNIYSNLL